MLFLLLFRIVHQYSETENKRITTKMCNSLSSSLDNLNFFAISFVGFERHADAVGVS